MSQDEKRAAVRPQPMIAVADVPASSRWYQQVLGATSGHGGAEYEQLLVDGQLIMQLHEHETGHHHGTIGDPAQPDVHLNPNAGHREIWLRDPDGYLVVLAEPYQA